MEDRKKKKRGRPVGTTSTNPANKMLPVKVTKERLEIYKTAANKAGTSLSDFIRLQTDLASIQVGDEVKVYYGESNPLFNHYGRIKKITSTDIHLQTIEAGEGEYLKIQTVIKIPINRVWKFTEISRK